MSITLYRFDQNLDVVEKGKCELGGALRMLDECCLVDLGSMKSFEKAMSDTSFGLSKSNEDFIEVSYDGRDLVSVHTDRLYFSTWISKWIGFQKHLYIQGDKDNAKTVIHDYYQLERHAFERKYAKFICR